jgi:putative transposase
MPRLGRAVAVGLPHHLTQRGNNRQDVFFTADDRRLYLGLLAANAARFRLRLWGWCLMTNHVHLVAVPETPEALAAAVGRTHFEYARAINRLHGRSGHLWQGRFFSCALDGEHARAALVYVERNPVRARLARRAWAWPWSSAAAHVGDGGAEADGPLAADDSPAARLGPAAWRELLVRPEDAALTAQLRGSTRTGRPLGTDSFVSKLEAFLGRRLRALPSGRPRKTARETKKE